ncbi:MAG: TolC family protein, partial [Bacteroidaceae bacterium]|nr:TolC family protein [Bacteroidaceae bacterium]
MSKKLKKRWLLMVGAMLMITMAKAQGDDQANVIKLTLENAIEIAVSENPTIIVADQQIELKKISKQETWQSLLPSVDFSGTVQYTV